MLYNILSHVTISHFCIEPSIILQFTYIAQKPLKTSSKPSIPTQHQAEYEIPKKNHNQTEFSHAFQRCRGKTIKEEQRKIYMLAMLIAWSIFSRLSFWCFRTLSDCLTWANVRRFTIVKWFTYAIYRDRDERNLIKLWFTLVIDCFLIYAIFASNYDLKIFDHPINT